MFDGDGPWNSQASSNTSGDSQRLNGDSPASRSDSFEDPFGGAASQGTSVRRTDAGGAITKKVLFGVSLPHFALVGAKTMATTKVITSMYDADEGNSAEFLTVAAFSAILAASSFQVAAGHFGDGWRTEYGRRRPLVAMLAPLCAASGLLIFHSFSWGGQAYYAVVFGALMVFTETAQTMLHALGTEMTAVNNRDTRTAFFACQQTAGTMGFLAASIGSAATSDLSGVNSKPTFTLTLGLSAAMALLVSMAFAVHVTFPPFNSYIYIYI